MREKVQAYQQAFIELAIRCKALKFGEFQLKSGRISPYFFNAGAFQTGSSLAKLGRFYAEALRQSGVTFDMLLGPAYKGIPLVSATACAFAEHYNQDFPYAFNRKEAKNHGEGGSMVGAPLQGSVAIVDDVITAGTAIRDVLRLFEGTSAKPAVVVVGLDRNEKGQHGTLSAVQELEQATSVPVLSIVQLSDIIAYLENYHGDGIDGVDSSQLIELKDRIKQYRDIYGVMQ